MEIQNTGSSTPNGQPTDRQQTLEQRLEDIKHRQLTMLEEIGKKAEALSKVKMEIEALRKSGGRG